ncbi:hypothetical protein C5Z25_05975 [Lactobacillus sp. CBA3605]|uniref:hypothetical protein n=1 Tax=Lactobacillus sp. CBA3605 TaxID=2099788 RepID=UPI000CFCC364|nr:hypothetical protein [Lactobacillus sp. CBA3605]AVK61343.1 hypothetical protein C5Z25_05975 [Lactobacillus sp. CBA3605]
MDEFTTFITTLDQTLAQASPQSTEMVEVPVTFIFREHHLQVEMTTLQTSFNQGDNAFAVPDILDRIRMLVGLELADRPKAEWPQSATTKNLTISPHKVVRLIPVDMQAYRVD